ncbi:MAG: HEPN domain-containing protein [Candidatus Micrarchaeota archaeon]
MNSEKDVAEWLTKAGEDLEAATVLYEKAIFGLAAFHCQQTVEKALKAVYASRFDEVRRTHELVFLSGKVSLPPELLQSCERLNAFFLNPRYPGFREEVSHDDAKLALEDARKVFGWAKTILSKG